jgi:hypothetical protein
VLFSISGLPDKPARLSGTRVFPDRRAVERGVGGDQAVQPALQKNPARGHGFVPQRGRGHFEQQGHIAPMLGGESLLFALQFSQQSRAGLRSLQVPQARGVWRGQVHRDVACHRVGFAQTGQIVVGRPLVGRVLVFADVEPDDSAKGFGRRTLDTPASIPGLLKPIRLMIASWGIRRNNLGLGFPPVGGA